MTAPNPFPHEDRPPRRRHTGLDRLPRVTREEIEAARIARENDARRATEADLRRAIWVHDAPPEVDIDAMNAWLQVDPAPVEWPDHRWVRSAIAFTILAIGLLVTAYLFLEVGFTLGMDRPL